MTTQLTEAGIYIASKTAHAAKWRSFRADGVPIISTWIDEAGVGETSCFADLWRRCVSEAAGARALVVYREPGEVLKGAFVEAGAALAAGKPVFAVGCDEFSFMHHAGVTRCETVYDAVRQATAAQILLTPEGGGGLRGPTEQESEAPIYEAFARYVGDADERATEFRMFATGYHAALAPKTSAPGNDAGMREALAAWRREKLELVIGMTVCSHICGRVGSDERQDLVRSLLADFDDMAAGRHEFAECYAPALSPPTGAAGDDETGVREAAQYVHDTFARDLAQGYQTKDKDFAVAILGAALAPQPPKAETPAVVGEGLPRKASEQMVMAGYDHWRHAKPPGLFAGPKAEIEWMEEIINAALSNAPAARAGDGVEIPQKVRDRHTDAVVAKRAWQDGTGSWSATCAADIWFSQAALDWITSALTAAPAANGEDA